MFSSQLPWLHVLTITRATRSMFPFSANLVQRASESLGYLCWTKILAPLLASYTFSL